MALNINGTTGISGVDGSASAPALQGVDSNTGVSFGTDTVNINTGGATRATVDSSGNLNIPNDSGKIKLGASGDLQIFHESNNSKIVSTASQFSIFANGNLQIFNENGFANLADFIEGGACNLYYDAVKRFETGPGYNLSTGDVSPSATNTYNLGGTSARWATVYSSNALDTSDRNEKNTILESDLGLDFVNKLKPISYKWNDTNLGNKTHYGLIAQDVEEAIISEGKALNDFGAIEKPKADPMSLGYKELIAPLIKAIQELSAKVAALEAA